MACSGCLNLATLEMVRNFEFTAVLSNPCCETPLVATAAARAVRKRSRVAVSLKRIVATEQKGYAYIMRRIVLCRSRELPPPIMDGKLAQYQTMPENVERLCQRLRKYGKTATANFSGCFPGRRTAGSPPVKSRLQPSPPARYNRSFGFGFYRESQTQCRAKHGAFSAEGVFAVIGYFPVGVLGRAILHIAL